MSNIPGTMYQSQPLNTQPIRPRAIWYWIALVLLIAGIGIGVSGVMKFVRVLSQPPLAKILVPGSATVQIDKPGDYQLNYAYRTTINGKSYNLPPNDMPSIQASVTDLATQQPVTLTDISSNQITIATADTASLSVFSFDVNTPGQYLVDIAYAGDPPGTPTEIRVMSHVVLQGIATLFGSIALSFVLGLTALIVALVTLLRRGNAKRRRAAGGWN